MWRGERSEFAFELASSGLRFLRLGWFCQVVQIKCCRKKEASGLATGHCARMRQSTFRIPTI